MSDLQHTLQDLPIAGLVPVILLVVVGLLLWAAGRKLLHLGFAIIGLVVGGVVGWLLGEAMDWGVAPWIPAVIGGVGLAILSAVAFKLAVMWTLAAVLGIFAPLGVIAVNEQQARHGDNTLERAGDKTSEWVDKHFDGSAREKAGAVIGEAKAKIQDQLDEAKSKLDERLAEHPIGDTTRQGIEELKRFGIRLLDAFKSEWSSAPESLRPILVISCLAGVLLGLILGFLAPTFSGAVVTSLGGSLLWLTGLRLIALRMGVPEGRWMPSSGASLMSVWLITSLAGVGIQWMSKRRKADKSG